MAIRGVGTLRSCPECGDGPGSAQIVEELFLAILLFARVYNATWSSFMRCPLAPLVTSKRNTTAFLATWVGPRGRDAVDRRTLQRDLRGLVAAGLVVEVGTGDPLSLKIPRLAPAARVTKQVDIAAV